MNLQAGAQLGSYEIVSPLGAGGMGEVYKAKDLKLGRDVAIKVLPQEIPDVREWVLGESQGPKMESIAVLPLENLSGDAEQEYFVDGMTEALMTGLAKIGALNPNRK